ncbi:hypothetical protein BU25DRAFT_412214 [Macroventuria anomochaeta]|uniref:Uncharacterized protein n=1 Tax=Macroventuria anomochaeta TaxID=301207 RepID=A0ACB6RW17_9PLEO|nr:uncharacterized protein BU25DRAFT_412214 [Macroventuria anomochaeta]KAF2625969.1 hypothetical protein BU25DRAFT_412214 [Macroventuria anomochaeta]
MEHIRQAVCEFQLQSPAHFELGLEVHQINEQTNTSEAIVNVLFQGNTAEGHISVPCKCRVVLRRRRTKAKLWKCIIVTQDQSVEALNHFLSSNFPIIDVPLRADTLWFWWLNNGKNFSWTDLPTELKERVVEFCMHQPHTHGIYSEKFARFGMRYKNDRRIRKPGPFEIVDQLGDWYQILYVSHQVRAITLRLCITGGSSLIHSKGLCITASSYRTLTERIDRLGEYYQMIEPHSVPTTSSEQALSKCYRRFPHIYPELKQYATFRHGIQKISLSMDFLSFMHFFKVKAGGFQRYQKSQGLTYHTFERLPNLNEIVIKLPLRPREGWKYTPHPGGIQLFHEESPCPRSLHRVIYERVAEVLASFKVTMRNFIDDNEEQRFLACRLEAVEALKFTRLELEELYADDGGGVELPEGMEREMGLPRIKQQDMGGEYLDDFQDELFPPLCHCDEPCALSLVLGASVHH